MILINNFRKGDLGAYGKHIFLTMNKDLDCFLLGQEVLKNAISLFSIKKEKLENEKFHNNGCAQMCQFFLSYDFQYIKDFHA